MARQQPSSPDATASEAGRFSLILLANRIRLIAIVLGAAALLIAAMGYTALDRQGDSASAQIEHIEDTAVTASQLQGRLLSFQLQITLSALAPTDFERQGAATRQVTEREAVEALVAQAQNSSLASMPEWATFSQHYTEYFSIMDSEVSPRVA